jgi:hypothetical protein
MAPWAEASRYLIRDREAYGAAVTQVEAEYSEFEHLLGCPLRLELRIEVLPHGRSQLIPMSLLHSHMDREHFAFTRALFFGVRRLAIVCALQRLSSQIEKLRTVANATQADSGRRQ